MTMKAKYMWGSDDPFPTSVAFLTMGIGCAAVSATILSEPEGKAAISNGCSIESVKLTILATILYFGIFYGFLGQQTALNVILKSTNKTANRTAERIVLNTVEQRGPFLVFTWLFTVYIDAGLGGRLGLLYAVATLLYAFEYAYYDHFTCLVDVSTQPRYTMIVYMALALLRSAFWPDLPTLRAVLPSSQGMLTAILFFGSVSLHGARMDVSWNATG